MGSLRIFEGLLGSLSVRDFVPDMWARKTELLFSRFSSLGTGELVALAASLT